MLQILCMLRNFLKIFCCLQIFFQNYVFLSEITLIRVLNSLDLDQDRHLGPNSLQKVISRQKFAGSRQRDID